MNVIVVTFLSTFHLKIYQNNIFFLFLNALTIISTPFKETQRNSSFENGGTIFWKIYLAVRSHTLLLFKVRQEIG
jgi:hypothetical protein